MATNTREGEIWSPELTYYVILSVQFSAKNMRPEKEKVWSVHSKQAIETVSEEAEKLVLLDKDFELVILIKYI